MILQNIIRYPSIFHHILVYSIISWYIPGDPPCEWEGESEGVREVEMDLTRDSNNRKKNRTREVERYPQTWYF